MVRIKSGKEKGEELRVEKGAGLMVGKVGVKLEKGKVYVGGRQSNGREQVEG